MQMPAARYALGATEVLAFNDGPLKSSLNYVIGMPLETARSLVGGQPDDPVYISVNVFLLNIEGRRVLIDAGAGHAMQPTLGRLPGALRAAGIEPGSIDAIVLTHIHPDHANGLLDPDGEKQFPSAEIIVHEREAAFWLDRPEDAHDVLSVRNYRPTAQKALAPYRDRTRRVQDGDDVFGALTPMLAEGHTPGHTAWLFRSGAESMLFWGDVIHFAAIQIVHPDVALTYDLHPAIACRTRHRMLEFAHAERLLVGGAHVDAPGVGRVVKGNSGYSFEPLEG